MVTATELRKKLTDIRGYVNHRVLEREIETDSAIVSILSGESCLLLGDAGSGKTYNIEILCQLMQLRLFKTLISQSTKPQQIFGPPDVPALGKGIQRNKIENYAANAEVIFLDEVFKATGVVLNPLLWVLNEHIYDNGDDGIIKCPTVAVFAASNEVPTAKEDRPIYDRFLIRHNVQYIKDQKNLHKLMNIEEDIPRPAMLTGLEIRLLRQLVKRVEFKHEEWELVIKIRNQVQTTVGNAISDRRLLKTVGVIKAHAFLHGRKQVESVDLEMLAHMFWDAPEQSRKVKTIVLANCNAEKGDLMSYTETADSVYEKAIKTGNFKEAYAKLKELARTTKQLIDSVTGKQVHRGVISQLRSVKAVLVSRTELVVFALQDADGHDWYKLSEVSSGDWTADQLRAVGFKWRRTLGYWWRPLKGKNAHGAFVQQVAKTLGARVIKKGIV